MRPRTLRKRTHPGPGERSWGGFCLRRRASGAAEQAGCAVWSRVSRDPVHGGRIRAESRQAVCCLRVTILAVTPVGDARSGDDCRFVGMPVAPHSRRHTRRFRRRERTTSSARFRPAASSPVESQLLTRVRAWREEPRRRPEGLPRRWRGDVMDHERWGRGDDSTKTAPDPRGSGAAVMDRRKVATPSWRAVPCRA